MLQVAKLKSRAFLVARSCVHIALAHSNITLRCRALSFTLAKVSAITPATVTATHISHYLPWQLEINRNYPICVVSPKVDKASTMVTVSRIAGPGVIALHFANVNTAYKWTPY